MRRLIVVASVVIGVTSLAGCGSASHVGETAVVQPSRFASCFRTILEITVDVSRQHHLAPWEHTSHPTRVLSLTLLNARNPALIAAPTADVAFYRTAHAAAQAAAGLGSGAGSGAVQARLNTVVAFAGIPSSPERSLVNGCITAALTYSKASP